MARTIPVGLVPELYRLYSSPIHIIDLYLESPFTTPSHYYCINNKDITFNSQTYVAIAAKRTSIKSEEGTVVQEITVQLDNIDLEFKDLIISGMLNRKRCDIKLVFDGFLSSSSNFITLYSGFLDAPSGDNRWVSLVIKPFPMFEREYPRRLFQVGCNWTFGDDNCGMTLTDYERNLTVGVGSTVTTINFSVEQSFGENWAVPGYVLMTSGDLEGRVRPVYYNDNFGVIVRVAFEDAPAEGDTFTLQKLCSKTVSYCKDIYDNYLNYGGFPTVPSKPVL